MKTKTLFTIALIAIFSFASCVSTRTTVSNDEDTSAHSIDEDGDFVWDDYAN